MVKYYAIKIGRNPGIYTNWDDAKKQIINFSGAVFKSFKTEDEANEFLNVNKINNNIIDNNREIIYTDGSYSKKDNNCGFGFVHVKNDSYDEYHGPVIYDKCSNNIAELYAIKTAIENIKGNLEIRTDSEYSINVLTGKYKAHINTELINYIIKLMENRNIIFTHVMAHTGDKFNEIADTLANKGRNTK